MTTNREYGTLLRRSLIVTSSCIFAVVICYFWVDRTVTFFISDHHINNIAVSAGSLTRQPKCRTGRR